MSSGNSRLTSRVDVLNSFDPIDRLASDWNRLANGVPFRSFEWYRTWWANYGQGDELQLYVLRQADEIVAIFPLFIERRKPMGTVLRLLGSGEVCSDQQGILWDPSMVDPQAVGFAFASMLAHEDGRLQQDGESKTSEAMAFDLIELDGLSNKCDAMWAFRNRLQQLQFTQQELPTPSTWKIPLPSKPEDYLALLSKPSRRKVRTAWKRIDAQDFCVEFVRTPEQFERIWPIFVALHQDRRRSLGQSGCFTAQSFTNFLRDFAMECLGFGNLEFVYASKGDTPVATELCFRGDSITFAYQLGINPEMLRDNPGWLINAASIRQAIEQGQSAFDLCRGDEEYKRHLGAEPSFSGSIRLVPPRIRSQVWNAALVTQSAIKDWLKSGLSMTGVR
jgi:CelD/BcsL family acetyltransferase involved in cellulose biosynthesis